MSGKCNCLFNNVVLMVDQRPRLQIKAHKATGYRKNRVCVRCMVRKMSLSVLAREDAWSSAQLKKKVLARRGAVRVV